MSVWVIRKRYCRSRDRVPNLLSALRVKSRLPNDLSTATKCSARMPIEQLPQSSISSLQSSQTLTHPPSLIKELVENSIDAGATSISIEVLPNLLDSIQVRDNGHGISPDGRDRELVAKRHCTSKITCMKDLDTVKTLGFRG